jgi:hypothetical protein
MAERRRVDGGRARRGALAGLVVLVLLGAVTAGVAVRRVVGTAGDVGSAPPAIAAEVGDALAEPAATTVAPTSTTEAEPPTTLVPPGLVPLTVPPPPPPATQPPPPPPPPGVVSVYGDSLVWEARHALGPMLDEIGPNRIHSWGGTALCDFSRKIVDEARTEPTRLVVIGFTGNALTPCMKTMGSSPSRDLVTAMYTADLDAVVGELHALGVPVLLIGAPPSADASGATHWTPINAAWADAAAKWRALGADVAYADTGLALADSGRWAATLPCLPGEGPDQGCIDGRIPVRAPDSVHFCPRLAAAREGVIPDCAVWNGGAWRYAQAIRSAIGLHL